MNRKVSTETQKNENQKKGALIKIAIAALVVIVAVVGFFFIRNYQQEQTLTREVEKLTKKDLTKDEYNVDIKTSGDYGVIEKEIKEFFKEVSDIVKSFSKLESDEEFINILTVDNFKADGPEFEKSLQKVSDVRNEVKKSIDRFAELCTKEYMDSLIEKHKLSSRYVDLFEKLMYTEEDLKDLQEAHAELAKVGKAFDVFLNDCEDILNFLKKNKSQWVIENDSIIFKTDSLLAQYQKMTKKLVEDSNF